MDWPAIGNRKSRVCPPLFIATDFPASCVSHTRAPSSFGVKSSPVIGGVLPQQTVFKPVAAVQKTTDNYLSVSPDAAARRVALKEAIAATMVRLFVLLALNIEERTVTVPSVQPASQVMPTRLLALLDNPTLRHQCSKMMTIAIVSSSQYCSRSRFQFSFVLASELSSP
jgi:hypothetical protein